MFRSLLLLATTVVLTSLAAFEAYARTVTVTGRGSASGYCNTNSGAYCLDGIKRRAEQDALRDAQRTCEFNYRGRPGFYASYSSICNPPRLPINHDGTSVNCNSSSSLNCEVN